jgi:predicted PurR-regulated permease PerM
VLTFIGLSILQIPYALPLAIIAGTLEVVPNIGPVVSSIPSILVALTVSPFVALLTAALYVVVQQFENHLIVPLVMKRVVGLPPIVTILALMVGARLSGISGALLSVPIVVTAETILMEVLKSRDNK